MLDLWENVGREATAGHLIHRVAFKCQRCNLVSYVNSAESPNLSEPQVPHLKFKIITSL